MTDFNPLENASPELVEAVEAMGGEAFLSAIHELVQDNEEFTVEWFDAEWNDSTADEIIEWSIARLAATGPGIAHAALDVALKTFPVDEGDENVGDATIVTAFVRVVLGSPIRADRYELDFTDLGAWILHDAVRVVDESPTDMPSERP